MTETTLRDRREVVVRERMDSENRQDFEDDRIVCERVCFDSATILALLGLAG